MNRLSAFAAIISLTVSLNDSEARGAADGNFGRQPTWTAPTAEQLRAPVADALKNSGTSQELIDRAIADWQLVPADATGSDLLDRLTRVLAQAKPEAKQLVDLCSAQRKDVKLPTFSI